VARSRRQGRTRTDEGVLPSADDAVGGALAKLFGRDSLYVLLWGAQIVAAALVTPLMTRALDAPSFGNVATANAVMQVLFVLVSLGLYQALQKEYAADPGGSGARALLAFSALAAVALCAVLHATGPLWAPLTGFSSFDTIVVLAVWWACGSSVANSALALLRSQDRLLAFSVVSLLQSVVAAAVSLLLVVLWQPTATTYLYGQVGMHGLAAALGLLLSRPRAFGRRDRLMIRRALGFSLPLVPAVLSTFILNASDRLILQAELGPASVARYHVAYNVASLPMLLLGLLNSAWMPRIFAVKDPAARALVVSTSRDLLLRLLVPVMIGMAAGAPLVLALWAPDSYRPDGLLVVYALVLLTAVPYAAAQAATRTLMAEGRTPFIAVSQAGAAGTNVALNLALIPVLGIAGAALATLISFALLQVVVSRRARKVTGLLRVPLPLAGAMAATGGLVLATCLVPAEAATAVRYVVVAATLVWFAAGFLSTNRSLRAGPTER
jgi:O-antigen/teichoic acid export membrane protein